MIDKLKAAEAMYAILDKYYIARPSPEITDYPEIRRVLNDYVRAKAAPSEHIGDVRILINALKEIEVNEDRGNLDGDSAEVALEQCNAMAEEALEEYKKSKPTRDDWIAGIRGIGRILVREIRMQSEHPDEFQMSEGKASKHLENEVIKHMSKYAAPAESRAAGEDNSAPIPSGKTRAELDKGFEEFSRSLRSNYKEMTGRDYDTDFSIKHAPRDQSQQLAEAQARINMLDKELTYEHGRHHLTHERAEKAESRVAVLEKALEADKARLDFLDTLPKHGGWDLQCNGYGYPHLLDTTYGTKIREAIDSAKPEILAARSGSASQPSREKEG